MGGPPARARARRRLSAFRSGILGSVQGSGSVAAIDCGTNSTRLIVVAPDGEVLERDMRITRLGQGVDATRKLSPVAVDRTLSVLREYRRAIDAHGVASVRVVATSAARDATNAGEFMDGVARVMGVRPEVLSGDEEGRLSFAGATARLPPEVAGTEVLVVDIGGGSTELVVGQRGVSGDGGRAEPTVCSLDLGCVRVSERYLRHDPPRPDELEHARAVVRERVIDARSSLPELPAGSLLIGLAGTVSTLACLQYGVTDYERARVHHVELTRGDVEKWLATLAGEDSRARAAQPGMAPDREDVIVGGVLVLAVVMECFGCERCLTSEDDILDGLAAELLGAANRGG